MLRVISSAFRKASVDRAVSSGARHQGREGWGLDPTGRRPRAGSSADRVGVACRRILGQRVRSECEHSHAPLSEVHRARLCVRVRSARSGPERSAVGNDGNRVAGWASAVASKQERCRLTTRCSGRGGASAEVASAGRAEWPKRPAADLGCSTDYRGAGAGRKMRMGALRSPAVQRTCVGVFSPGGALRLYAS
jgi:hypothetical protein